MKNADSLNMRVIIPAAHHLFHIYLGDFRLLALNITSVSLNEDY